MIGGLSLEKAGAVDDEVRRRPKDGSSSSGSGDSLFVHALSVCDISEGAEQRKQGFDRSAPRHQDSPQTTFSRPGRNNPGWRSASLCIAVFLFTCTKGHAFEAASGKADGAQGQEEVVPGDQLLTVHDMPNWMADNNETGLLVEFFLPWCGHSRRLRPEFQRAAAAMEGKPFFARVDCSTGTGSPLCQQNDVQYHPTILLFMRGMVFEYQQRVTSKALVRYCKHMLEPPVRVLAGIDETVATLQEQQVLVVAFHKPGEQYEPFYAEVAENLRDQMMFASVSDEAYIEKLGVTQTLLWTEAAAVKQEDSLALAFSRFITGAHVLLVDTLTQENFYPKLGLGAPTLILFTDDGGASAEATRNLYQPAMDFKGRINFCTLNGIRYQALALKVGVAPRVLPALVILDVANSTQFVLPASEPITEASVARFCNSYSKGLPAPHSPLCPATLPPGGDFPHDVVRVLQLMGALNISSFPTIMLFPAHNKTGIVFNGGRTASELTDFLRTHAGTKLAESADGQLVPEAEAEAGLEA